MTDLPPANEARPGDRVAERGRLVRGPGGFVLRSDRGATLMLLLSRTPVDHVEKAVALSGTLVEPGVIEVDAIRAAG